MPFRFRSAVLALGFAGSAAAQVPSPPPPEKYHADIRYSIRADRDERIRQFRAMTDYLGKLGFVADPRDDADQDVFDPSAERMAGTISSANAAKLLDDPRIRTVLLTPAGVVAPEDPAKAVPLNLTLRGGLDQPEQLLLHEQVVRQLARMGFRENVGYDHRGFTRVRGTIPAVQVPDLLKDLRDLPGGWFAAEVPRDRLPLPLRTVLPVRLVEVLPDIEGQTTPLAALSVVGKVSPDLRAAVADPATAGKPLRVEAILYSPPESLPALRGRVQTLVPGATIEGLVGGVVSVRLPAPAGVDRLAQIEDVAAVRLPVLAADGGRGGPAGGNVDVAPLHAHGYRGAGSRVVVVAAEFPGAAKELPKAKFIDLTAENSLTLEPAPAGAGPSGTAAAAAAHAAAPDAELVLVRIDPAAFHQLYTVAQQVAGEPVTTVALQTRGIELTQESGDLARRREIVTNEYRDAFADLSDDEKPAARRAKAKADYDKLVADETAFKAKFSRFTALRDQLLGLHGATVVVNTLVWEAGFPHDGLSPLSQYLSERFGPRPIKSRLAASRPGEGPVWVQAASDGAGSVWAGPFLDADGNGVMEYSFTGAKRPAGTWTSELNFLGSAGADGKVTDSLPAGGKLRLAIQWREPIPLDPNQPSPVFAPSLRLLRQLDPSGSKAAADEFTEVARTSGRPILIQVNPASAVYEQVLEVTLPAAGRYALRLEGRTSAEGGLPGLGRVIEVQPRVVVRGLDSSAGRVVFTTFAPTAAGVGVPGDSPAALTVGAGVGLTGSGPGVTLRVKPDLIVPGAGSSAAAAGTAGGLVASLSPVGIRGTNLPRALGIPPGGMLVLPGDWVRSLPR